MDYKELLRDRRIILLLIAIAVAGTLVLVYGLHFGLEFIGGVRIPVTLEKSVNQATMSDIINTIKLRVTKYGMSQVNVQGIGSSEIYVEIPRGDAAQIQSIETILQEQGKYEGIVDGQVAVTGEDFLAGSIGEPQISVQGNNVQWQVSFAISQDAAKRFSQIVLGKANYPLYMFLDRYDDGIILVNKSDLLTGGAGVTASEDQVLTAVRDAVRNGNNTIPIFIADDFNTTKAQIAALNTTKKRVILSNDMPEDVIDALKGMNYIIVNKSKDDMKPKLQASSQQQGEVFPQGSYTVTYWGAANLLSAPTLVPGITNGEINQFYMINGYAPQGLTLDQKNAYALNEGKSLRSVLSGGALPVEIIIGTPTLIPPSLGEEFLKYSGVGALASALAMSLVIFIRYREPRIVLPIIATILLEMGLTLSIVGTVLGTVDLGMMAGIIGATGEGVNSQIIITDELLRWKKGNEERNTKAGIARAFFIVVTVASIAIVAMLPLLFSGLVDIMGYALSVIVEVLIGVLITRPAFAAVIERIVK